MDLLNRRRSGKGIGTEGAVAVNPSNQGSSEEAVQSAEAAADAGEVTLRAENQETSVERAGQYEAASSAPHPFWSQRAQEEWQAQNFLGTASSSSTELRPAELGMSGMEAPSGPPTVYGPSLLQTTVREGVGSNSDTVRAVTGDTGSGAHSDGEIGQLAGEEGSHGLSVRERNILTAMKDAMVQISHRNDVLQGQNDALMRRILRLEEERSTNPTTWHSAEENHDRVEQPGSHRVQGGDGLDLRGDRDVLGTMKYEEGYQQGYLAAKEMLQATQGQELVSPPKAYSPSFGGSPAVVPPSAVRDTTPPPNDRRIDQLGCNTTPQGTPVPRGSPPAENAAEGLHRNCGVVPFRVGDHHGDVGRRDFGMQLGFGDRQSGLRQSLEGGGRLGLNGLDGGPASHYSRVESSARLSGQQIHFGSPFDPGLGSAASPLNLPVLPRFPTNNDGSGFAGSTVPYVRDSRPSDSTATAAVNLPELPGGVEGSRDPYAPGDKVYWQLPALADVHDEPDPATRASDWIQMVTPLMSDITPMSGVWWTRVLAEAQHWYQTWTCAPTLERGLVRPQPSSELMGTRFKRLESRAYAMLLAAIPVSVRDELVANRETHCVALLYHVLRTYQPGGLHERTTFLEVLSCPGVTNSAMEAVQKLRGWGRALNRAVSMQISIPDASLMLRGIDQLADPLLKKHPHDNAGRPRRQCQKSDLATEPAAGDG